MAAEEIGRGGTADEFISMQGEFSSGSSKTNFVAIK